MASPEMANKKDQIITRVGSEEIRKSLKKRAIDDGTTVQALVEGWINEYVSGGRIATHGALPTEGTCPLCESTLGIAPEGLTLIKTGPIEQMASGETPEELVPLMRSVVQYYLTEPFFRRMLNAVIADYKSAKK